MVLKAPIIKQWLIRRPKYFNPLNLDHFMMQISTYFFNLLNLYFWFHFFVRVSFWFMLKLIIIFIQCKIMITSYDNLIFIWQFLHKCNKPINLSSERVLCEISSMDKNIGLGEFRYIDLIVCIVRVTHGYYSYLFIHFNTLFNLIQSNILIPINVIVLLIINDFWYIFYYLFR